MRWPQKTWREQIEARIARKRDDLFLPREFVDLGGEGQVLHGLHRLVRDGRLVRLCYGLSLLAESAIHSWRSTANGQVSTRQWGPSPMWPSG
jgi:hypothetical protein